MRTIIRNDYDPQPGDYHERIIIDEARDRRWLFDCDGVFMPFNEIEVVNERGNSTTKAVSQKLFTDTVEGIEGDIDDLQAGLADEIATREAADDFLQEEIDDIKNSPDVVDIVPTYAALQAYDTSKLGDNDIIRVLADETHDGQSTYYRWNKAASTWTYIGAVGPYYTKDQTDALLNTKQDTLTAGDNIQISAQNVISATDTTYSDFTGTDGTAVGASGLVPAPATTDVDKFLNSDGTWKEANGVEFIEASDITFQDIIPELPGTYFIGSIGSISKTCEEIINIIKSGKKAVLRVVLDENEAASITPPVALWSSYDNNYYIDLSFEYDDGEGEGVVSGALTVMGENGTIGGFTPFDIMFAMSTDSSDDATLVVIDTFAIGMGALNWRIGTTYSAPTTSTVGVVGQLLVGTGQNTKGKVYVCTDVIPGTDPDPDTYVWQEVGVSTINSQDWSVLWQ